MAAKQRFPNLHVIQVYLIGPPEYDTGSGQMIGLDKRSIEARQEAKVLFEKIQADHRVELQQAEEECRRIENELAQMQIDENLFDQEYKKDIEKRLKQAQKSLNVLKKKGEKKIKEAAKKIAMIEKAIANEMRQLVKREEWSNLLE